MIRLGERKTGAPFRAVIFTVAAVFALSACGDSSDNDSEAASSSEAFAAVVIEHSQGSTEIKNRPLRVVALTNEEDALGAVGIAPVGIAGNYYEPGQPYPWQVDKVDLTEAETVIDPATAEINLEKVAATQPDLILATDGRFGYDDFYTQLSAIAPTIAGVEGTWDDKALIIGQATGQEEQMQGVVDGVDDYLAGLKTEYPGIEGKTFVSAYSPSPGVWNVSTDPTSAAVQLNQAIGLVPSQELIDNAPDGTLSLERLDLLDADLLLVSFGGPEARDAAYANPQFAGLQVVKDGRVFESDEFGAQAASSPTVLNIPWFYDQQAEVLAKVANS
jgi:iron complex transport system substrate-binding protein